MAFARGPCFLEAFGPANALSSESHCYKRFVNAGFSIHPVNSTQTIQGVKQFGTILASARRSPFFDANGTLKVPATQRNFSKPFGLFVVGEIGRIGQTWVESSMPVRFTPGEATPSILERTHRIIALGTFEGSILTDWHNPYSIRLSSDTLYLTSTDSFSGFVPITSRKFPSPESDQHVGLIQRPMASSALRKGVAHTVLIYPVSGERAQVILFQEGEFTRLPFKEFQNRFSESTPSPNID